MASHAPQQDDAIKCEIHTLNFCVSFVLENQNLDIFSIFSIQELLKTTQSCVDVMDKLLERHNQRLHISTHETRFIANTIHLHHRLFNRLCVDIADRNQAQCIKLMYSHWNRTVSTMRTLVVNARTLSDSITRSVFNFHISKIDVALNSPPVFYKLVQVPMQDALKEIFPDMTIAEDIYHSFQVNGYSFSVKCIIHKVEKSNPLYKCRKHLARLSKKIQNAEALQNILCSSLNPKTRSKNLQLDPTRACLKLIQMYQHIRRGIDDTRLTFFNAVMHHNLLQLLPVKFRHTSLHNMTRWNFKIKLRLTPALSHSEGNTLLARTKPILLATHVQSLVHLCQRHGMPWEMADRILSFTINAVEVPLSINFNSIHPAFTNVAG